MKQLELGEIRALVVDDSSFFAEMTADTLTNEHDIETEFETSAREALATLEAADIDCIVSDYQMPGMNGLEFLESVRDRYGDIPFILLTGRGDEEIASEAIASGVSDYLLKLEVVEDEQYERLAERIRNIVVRAQTRKMYELLVDNSPDVIAHVDRDGTILTSNPAMAELLDVERSDLVGVALTEVFPEPVGTQRLESGQAAIEQGTPTRTEDRHDGRYFHNIFVPVEGRSTEQTFQIISRDITERKEREQALERQNERLDKFAGIVSHDLRNPLNVAANSVDGLEEESAHVDRLDRSLDRMEAIIDDVLTLAKQGETVSEPSPADLEKMATDAWSYVDTGEATLAVDIDEYVMADASRLKELLSNLFRNAMEHGSTSQAASDDVTVTVGLLSDGFYVADDGPGIPEDEREAAFEVGYSTSAAGTGFGLGIVDEIARAHGWNVTVTESDAGGARFEITDVTFR
jgi:PAS domain S-box-containing protein